ncbi:MAG: type II toxin-antitoxin system VapC family toxin [Methylococcales bacterium]
MPVRVVDASALAAVLFNEPGAGRAAAKLTDATLVAPTLLNYEVASICLKKLKLHPKQRKEILAAYRLAKNLAIEFVELDYEAVLELAELCKLTIYDAAYLWLAKTLSADVVTLDRQLAKAVARFAKEKSK